MTAVAAQAGESFLRAAVAAQQAGEGGRVSDLVRHATAAAALVAPDDAPSRFRAASLLQMAFRFTGDPRLFDLALAECLAVADRTDLPGLAIPARALAGNVLMLAGRLHQAIEHCDAALALARAVGLENDRVGAMGHQFRGYVLFEWNRIAEARAALERAWTITSPSDRGVRSGVARVLAEVAMVVGNRHAAADWLARLEAIVAEPMTLRNREWLAAVRARIGFASRRDHAELDAFQRRFNYRPGAMDNLDAGAAAARLHELTHLATLLEATRQWPALQRTADAIVRGSAPLRIGALVRGLTCQAIALDGLGSATQALATWAHALEAAEEGGFVRVFAEGSPRRLDLLEQARRRPESARAAERVLAALHPAGTRAGHQLTTRQADVLRLVAQGLTDHEVSVATGLAVPTVKTHLRAIYERLAVRSRTAAVARARASGLL